MSVSKRLKSDTVEVRGESFRIRQWNALERAEFLKRLNEADLRQLAPAYLAHRCTINEDGSLLWAKETDAQGEPPDLTDGLLREILYLSDPARFPKDGEAKEDDAKKG